MPENILVVEYEPRYTDRVRQALSGQPFNPSFAKDGEEALRVLQTARPTLIVLSSVVPKVSATDLIRAIRSERSFEGTPILLTVAGYSGSTPKADAQRLGASDILPKPYSEAEFLGKVQQMLAAGPERGVRTTTSGAHVVRPTSAPAATEGGLTSDDIFGEIINDKPASPAHRPARSTNDVDKMLADTLADVMPKKSGRTAPGNEVKPKTYSGSVSIDKMVSDTLSGLEKGNRGRVPSTPPAEPQPAAAAPAAAPEPPRLVEKIPSSQPIFPPSAPAAAAAPEEEEPTDGTRFGQYVLLEKIAAGGMAEVWKARMRGVEGFQKIVAIKKILPHLSADKDFVEMFVDEAKLAAQLNHNNIVHIYDLGKIQSSYYIAMEYVDGFDLKTILRRAAERDHPMSVELALFITSKIASALDYAHRKRDFEERDMGLVHRDVSPQNVLISQEGDIKLCDFGIAKATSKASSHTQAGALKGKLQYMAPEQAWGKAIDRRTDVFALATVLFEMLTGRKLFAGENEMSILEQVREARVVAPSEINDEVSPEIDKIVLRALAREPENRYQTAGEMAREIDQILYSLRPTPTAADLAIYMHHLSAPIEAEPPAAAEAPAEVAKEEPAAPAIAPVAVAAAPAVAAVPAHVEPAPAPFASAAMLQAGEEKKKSMLLPAIIAAVVIVGGAAAYLLTRGSGKSQTAAPVASTATSAAAPVSATSGAPLATDTATGTLVPLTASTGSMAPTATQAPLDQAQIDEEVRRRLESERAKLGAEQTRATQQVTPAPAPAPQRAAAPVQPPPVQQTVTTAPPPQVTETRAPAPQPAPDTASAPPPAAAQPEAPRVREGDLVPSGTEGLKPAHMTRRAMPTYPPIARSQRVTGTVFLNVLVSETGQILDVRVIKGVARGGLNQAAEQSVRQSQFAPGTKDGVRVKSWAVVSIDFKL